MNSFKILDDIKTQAFT